MNGGRNLFLYLWVVVVDLDGLFAQGAHVFAFAVIALQAIFLLPQSEDKLRGLLAGLGGKLVKNFFLVLFQTLGSFLEPQGLPLLRLE